MGTRYLLDTSALIAHFRHELGAERVQNIFDEAGAEILIASLSIPEFSRRLFQLGFSQSEAEEVMASYRLLIDHVVSLDEAIGKAALEIGQSTKERLPLADALIAAAAKARCAILVHRDKHMAAIPGELIPQNYLGE